MPDGPVHDGSETPASEPTEGPVSRSGSPNTGAVTAAPPASAPGVAAAGALSRQLGGDLPCVMCKYNLRGLSIRSVCPECGTAVRATILALVDPHAAEFEPITSPRLTALGLVVWVAGALLAALLAWLPAPSGRGYGAWHVLVAASLIASGVGALALVRPHAGSGRLGTILAAMAVFLYAPLAWLVWEVTSWGWTSGQSAIFPFVALFAHERSPTVQRLLVCVLVAAIALLIRPNARLLVARSLALRTGRVDRQTILAIVAAAAIAALGETSLAVARASHGTFADTTRLAGQILVPAGWALVTLGMVGSLIDAVRIAKSILMPAPTLGQVIASGVKGAG
jgi:hypothetical protein